MMATRTELEPRPGVVEPGRAPPASPLTFGQRAALGLVAVGMSVAGALFLPLWQATLDAPQYPGGLHMVAYGHGIEGDIKEIDSLNHYIGMRAFDPADVPEMRLWPVAVVSLAIAGGAAALTRRPVLRRLGLLWVWLVPVGVLADIQLRLYQYGHDLDPMAALRIPEFTPLVVGPTKVWNFTTWAVPGSGLWLIAAGALLLTLGPRLIRRPGTGRISSRAAPVMVLVLVTTYPGAAFADGEHEHHGHGPGGAEPVGVPAAQVDVPDAAPPSVVDAADADEAGAWLSERLAHARSGETIVLEPGAYRGDFVVDVPIELDGAGVAMLVTTGIGSTLTVRAPGTTIRGLHVHGSGPGPTDTPSGIRIEADGVTVEDSVVHDAYIGIGVKSASGARLVGNRITGREAAAIGGETHALGDDDGHAHHGASSGSRRGDAISLWDANGVLIRGNVLESARDGVLLSFGSDALIDGNVIRGSRYAVHSMYAESLTVVENQIEDNLSGLVLMYRGPALVLRNQITDNMSTSTGFGVLLKDVDGAEVVGNTLLGNRVGIHVDGPTGGVDPSATFTANTVAFNQFAVTLYPTAHGVFRGNSFVGNHVQVLARGRGVADRNVWSDRGLGNYWSSYQGYDAAGTGIGAVPHREGYGTDRLLEQAPVLTALATSPALRLLRAVEDRWTRGTPVLVDELPLTRPVARVRMFASEPAGTAPVAAAGTGLVLLALTPLLLTRRTGRPAMTIRRPVRATT